MVNPWRKYKSASKKKKQALHSLCVGLVFFLALYLVTRLFSITLCPIQVLFDHPCFGCGLTRGFIAILSFDLKKATEYHVLSIPLFIGGMIYAGLCLSDILFDRNDLERLSEWGKRKYMMIVYIVVLVISAYLNHCL